MEVHGFHGHNRGKATTMSPWPDFHSHGDHCHGLPSTVLAMEAMDLRAWGEPQLIMAMEPWRLLASMTMTSCSPPWASMDEAFHGPCHHGPPQHGGLGGPPWSFLAATFISLVLSSHPHFSLLHYYHVSDFLHVFSFEHWAIRVCRSCHCIETFWKIVVSLGVDAGKPAFFFSNYSAFIHI